MKNLENFKKKIQNLKKIKAKEARFSVDELDQVLQDIDKLELRRQIEISSDKKEEKKKPPNYRMDGGEF